MLVAFGFRVHSGWAAMVEVAGTPALPRVLARSRIVIADPAMAGSKQPYHAAAELPPARAESMVQAAIDSARGLAREALEAAIRALRSAGHDIAYCGIVTGSGKTLPGLKEILRSHALIHTAEGEMFRGAVIWAARECGLRVTGVREKEVDLSSLPGVQSLGKLIGPPWTQDQKLATVAALRALADVGKSTTA